ncbi:hypothetical protein BKA69DRAFT_1124349 [Paraphysoderma sedebokerense]|nr:hypothetical protein BKA69DRAFT_1124349 [Paraphysoderma sedebokerense]
MASQLEQNLPSPFSLLFNDPSMFSFDPVLPGSDPQSSISSSSSPDDSIDSNLNAHQLSGFFGNTPTLAGFLNDITGDVGQKENNQKIEDEWTKLVSEVSEHSQENDVDSAQDSKVTTFQSLNYANVPVPTIQPVPQKRRKSTASVLSDSALSDEPPSKVPRIEEQLLPAENKDFASDIRISYTQPLQPESPSPSNSSTTQTFAGNTEYNPLNHLGVSHGRPRSVSLGSPLLVSRMSYQSPSPTPSPVVAAHPQQHFSSKYQAVLDEQLCSMKIDWDDITVSELKDILRQRGKQATGKKSILVERLKHEIERAKISRASSSSNTSGQMQTPLTTPIQPRLDLSPSPILSHPPSVKSSPMPSPAGVQAFSLQMSQSVQPQQRAVPQRLPRKPRRFSEPPLPMGANAFAGLSSADMNTLLLNANLNYDNIDITSEHGIPTRQSWPLNPSFQPRFQQRFQPQIQQSIQQQVQQQLQQQALMSTNGLGIQIPNGVHSQIPLQQNNLSGSLTNSPVLGAANLPTNLPIQMQLAQIQEEQSQLIRMKQQRDMQRRLQEQCRLYMPFM